jgi:hypothetical protein
MRRVLINGGDVSLMDYCSRPGYASGGFITAPSGDKYIGVPITAFDTVPSYMREKPFLYINSSCNYMVHVPSSRIDTAGVSWQNDDGSANTNLCVLVRIYHWMNF